ncbi:MAG: hypothetical protein IKF71_03265 [Bacilli bacterium]|nr:hypothetical protein [Bacilli bacterium]
MKYQEYNPVPGCGCVIRTFSKLLDKDVSMIKNDLEEIAKQLECKATNDIEVFDEYFRRNHYQKKNIDIPVKDLDMKKGKYGVFCFKEDDYHMFAIVDGIIYDKNQRYLDMNVISIYEFVEK